jgi:hypothetical protein
MKFFKTLEMRRKFCKFFDTLNPLLWYFTIILMTYCFAVMYSMFAQIMDTSLISKAAFFGLGLMIFFFYVISVLLVSISSELNTISYHLRFVSKKTKMLEEDN